MDFETVEDFKDYVVIKNIKNFELDHVFECGQCFRWNKTETGSFIGVAFGRVIEVEKQNNDLIIYNTNKEEFNNIWFEYFDLNRDYTKIKEELSKDELLKKSVDFGKGIRILKQEHFELLISFIISSNNRIPMIKRAIATISEKWGEKIKYKDKVYYSFPTIEKLYDKTIEDFEKCSTGFRAKYIANTCENVYKNNGILEHIFSLNDDECHTELQKFTGVGPKVADCIMLFSMQKYSAFPVDVWVKRAMMHFYVAPDVSLKKIREFGRDKFGNLSGFAQQYLFYYARENNIEV
ncbi:N-glycosylase/DNA lyase [Clostridium acidisoli DSM 12555]|uniref:DNA-(apurinic or apyrimidinic site) lyase n=1 Tax=Clostridium acidisoli DSM 12555 TaxID=1121291 RepID=A0A1W1XGA4_9CLOT|nr:DNA glycosylase [Clostridium acidisoli]SMC23003.1 N-glycosylase/DNA lyase [Clostridium acidisoli DSM 12555]